jgi:1-acyl-sn-glycerol-3-phosphate acyltransferase
MDKFSEIRPYRDDEIQSVIHAIISDDECISALINLKLSHLPQTFRQLLKPVFRFFLRGQVRKIRTILDLQKKVASYMDHMIHTTMTGFTFSGIENLDIKTPYLFISNHRDITLDPAFVNYALHLNGGDTVRIAIGDNLLTKEFATHLMRINKSFIVKRSEKSPKKLLSALKLLSEYITHSLKMDRHSIWIAQREGRAKDGVDRSDAAIIKMFAINEGRGEAFPGFIRSLRIVPVAISYEYDPCDQLKGRELYTIDRDGKYIKGDQEDISSIATGITGYKGNVHLSFGKVLDADFSTAEEVAAWLDRQIVAAYRLHASNLLAYEQLYGKVPENIGGEKVDTSAMEGARTFFGERIAAMPEHVRPYVLRAYANPVISKLEFAAA